MLLACIGSFSVTQAAAKNFVKLQTDIFKASPSVGAHSALIRNLIMLKGKGKVTAQVEQVCLKDSKYFSLKS